MHVISNILVGLQILAGLVVIGLVLVQHGKGADMGASFGSGSSGSLFGAAGSANFLSRMTAVCATIFFLCTIGLAYMTNYRGGASALPSEGSTVLDRPALVAPSPAASAAAASAPVPAGAAQIPGIAAPQESPAASSSGVSTAPAAAPEAAAPASGVLAIPTK